MILKACVVCAALSPESRCPKHRRKPWDDGGKRRERTVSGSRQQRRARFVMLRDDGRCHICGTAGSAVEIDHVIALSEGGADDVSNMAPACKRCHAKKSQREAQRGRARRGRA